jgi:hypothetical protein
MRSPSRLIGAVGRPSRAQHQDGGVPGDEHRRDGVTDRRRQERVRDPDDGPVLDHHGSQAADDDEHDAVPHQEPGERHHERRDPGLRDDEPLDEPDDERHADADGDGHVPGPVVQQQAGEDHRRGRADVADGQVDLAEQQDEDDPDRDRGQSGHLHDEVHEVARAQERRVLRLEDHRDEDKPDDDRQAAEVPEANPSDVVAEVVGHAAARRFGRDVPRGRLLDEVGHAVASVAMPGTCSTLPAVIASTTSC